MSHKYKSWFTAETDSRFGRNLLSGGAAISHLHSTITTLAPNDVKSARWQRPAVIRGLSLNDNSVYPKGCTASLRPPERAEACRSFRRGTTTTTWEQRGQIYREVKFRLAVWIPGFKGKHCGQKRNNCPPADWLQLWCLNFSNGALSAMGEERRRYEASESGKEE